MNFETNGRHERRTRLTGPSWQNWLLVFVVCLSSGRGAIGDDVAPAATVIAAYLEAAQQAGTSGLGRQGTERWINLLSAAAQSDDPLAGEALAIARRLANSLGAWEESARLIDRELAIHASRDIDRARLCAEAGEIRRYLSRKTRRDEDRKAAIDALKQANAILAALPPDAEFDAERRSTAILHTIWIASLESECAGVQEQIQSLATYRSAQDAYTALLESHSGAVGPLARTEWTIQKIAVRMAIQALLIENYPEALRALLEIGAPSADTTSPSICIQEAANRLPVQSRRDLDGYVQCLRDWLDADRVDDQTCVVRWLLAEALSARGDNAAARALLTKLRDDSMAEFDRIEPQALENGAGGIYSFILRQLRDIQQKDGAVDEAFATNSRYLELYPHEEGLTNEAKNFALQYAIKKAAAETAIDAPKPLATVRWVLMGINAAIVAVVSWLLFRRSRTPTPPHNPTSVAATAHKY